MQHTAPYHWDGLAMSSLMRLHNNGFLSNTVYPSQTQCALRSFLVPHVHMLLSLSNYCFLCCMFSVPAVWRLTSAAEVLLCDCHSQQVTRPRCRRISNH